MGTSHRYPSRLLALAMGLLLAGAEAVAQESGDGDDASVAMNVAVTFRAGAVAATPRGTFPSVIIGESRRPTGPAGQEHGRTAFGPAFGLQMLIPFSESLGATLHVGTAIVTADFAADSARGPLRFEAQMLDVDLGVEWSVLSFRTSFSRGGLRSVYLGGGIGLEPAVLANRFEGPYSPDTATAPVVGVGSFASGEPFRTGVALYGAVGLRFAVTAEVELVAEARYAQSLNPMFSSEAVDDSDFAVDRFVVVAGVGWRF